MAVENILFNVLKHELVPEHYLLTKEEAEAVLSEKGLKYDQLPKIRKSDAAIKVLENINGTPVEEGRVVKVVRQSETAEEFVAYRLVIKG